MTPPRPTSEECSKRVRFAFNGFEWLACWYPQMGGYVGKCVVLLHACGGSGGPDPDDGFNVYVWHDGAFPFHPNDSAREPIRLHHCSPDQFIEFGQLIKKAQSAHIN